jgi:hypothetical protein
MIPYVKHRQKKFRKDSSLFIFREYKVIYCQRSYLNRIFLLYQHTHSLSVLFVNMRVLTGRGLCDELISRPEESYRLWCVVVCDLETSIVD